MAITINKQPTDQVVFTRENALFTVVAEGDGLMYQWQHHTPSGTKWLNTDATGSNTDTMLITAQSYRNGYKYRCMITDSSGAVVYSYIATLRIVDVDSQKGVASWQYLRDIANAIRERAKTTEGILLSEMAQRITGLNGIPEGVTEMEVVTCAGSGSTTLSIPCGLLDDPACVAVFSEGVGGTQTVTAGIWSNGMFVFWHNTSQVDSYPITSPLSNGILTLTASASQSCRFQASRTYQVVMWR